jgi:hypothetical protein
MMEKRCREEAAEKEHKEEERRHVAREEREKKLKYAPSESSNGGESRCPEKEKVASLHSVISMTC